MPKLKFYTISAAYCAFVIAGLYLLIYGVHGPHIWELYPFNGEARPS